MQGTFRSSPPDFTFRRYYFDVPEESASTVPGSLTYLGACQGPDWRQRLPEEGLYFRVHPEYNQVVEINHGLRQLLGKIICPRDRQPDLSQPATTGPVDRTAAVLTSISEGSAERTDEAKDQPATAEFDGVADSMTSSQAQATTSPRHRAPARTSFQARLSSFFNRSFFTPPTRRPGAASPSASRSLVAEDKQTPNGGTPGSSLQFVLRKRANSSDDDWYARQVATLWGSDVDPEAVLQWEMGP